VAQLAVLRLAQVVQAVVDQAKAAALHLVAQELLGKVITVEQEVTKAVAVAVALVRQARMLQVTVQAMEVMVQRG
jgi:hypothetical protein